MLGACCYLKSVKTDATLSGWEAILDDRAAQGILVVALFWPAQISLLEGSPWEIPTRKDLLS